MKVVQIFLFAVLCVFVTGCDSEKDPGTWYPNFDESQHVRIDPSLDSSKDQIFTDNLLDVLNAVSAKHNLDTYLVLVRETELGNDSADAILRRIKLAWWNARGFSKDRHVIIVWMQSRTKPQQASLDISFGQDVRVSSAELSKICREGTNETAEQAIVKLLENLDEQLDNPKPASLLSALCAGVLVIFGILFLIAAIGAFLFPNRR